MSDTYNVVAAADMGDDVLQVWGTVTHDDGSIADVEGAGWVSAMVNHYPPGDIAPGGAPRKGAKTRPMTPDEQQAYFRQCLGEPVAQTAPKVLFGEIPDQGTVSPAP